MQFLLDTDTASRLLRTERATLAAMRTSGATSISVSTVTQSELLFGARLRPQSPQLFAAIQTFLASIDVEPWDAAAAETHADVRAELRRAGKSAGLYDIMIAAHAKALGATLVTSDRAIKNLGIKGLRVVSWPS
jgi:tRNA(fMet)-specific endonuclease VapC